ncbi:MAG: dihydroorotase [bacterium]
MDNRLLIRGARIIDPANAIDQLGDLLLEDGRVAAVGEVNRPAGDFPELDARGLVATPGLVDIHVHLREPGLEYKEDIRSGAAAAVAGGFTAVCCMPNTVPPNDSRAVTDLIRQRAAEAGTARVHPVAAVTLGLEGKALTEMAELREAGAVAVSDDGHPIANAGIMRRALEYASTFGLPVINHCEELSLSRRAAMHEGISSAWTGLAAQPSSAEEVMLARDLILAGETGARYHAAHLSTAGSVALVRRAKADGFPVTAEVTVHHLLLTDEANLEFDTNTKCNPPLRTAADRAACVAGLVDGTIDALVTDHAPHTPNDKAVEFEDAPFGVIGLETALPLALRLVEQGVLDLPTLIHRMTCGPARCLGLDSGTLTVGAAADVTLIDPELRWTIQPEHFQSKSRNTPFGAWDVCGRAVTTIVGGRVVYRWPDGLVNG